MAVRTRSSCCFEMLIRAEFDRVQVHTWFNFCLFAMSLMCCFVYPINRDFCFAGDMNIIEYSLWCFAHLKRPLV